MSGRAFPPALVLVLAIIAGASMDATIKYLSQTNHVLLVAFGRYLFGAIFSFGDLAGTPAAQRSRPRCGARTACAAF